MMDEIKVGDYAWYPRRGVVYHGKVLAVEPGWITVETATGTWKVASKIVSGRPISWMGQNEMKNMSTRQVLTAIGGDFGRLLADKGGLPQD